MISSQTEFVAYSHGVLIKPGSQRVKEALLEYSYNLAQYSYNKVPPRWVLKKVIIKVYAAWNAKRTEFRYHRNLMDEIITFLGARGIRKESINVKELKPSTGVKVDFSKNTLHKPHDYQLPIIDWLSRPSVPIKVTNLQTGKGKDQRLDTPIRTPSGWTKMGDIKLGDEVISQDGSTTKVTAIYPQGVKQQYKVTFSDGRSVECGLEHLWQCYRSNWTSNNGGNIRTIDTKEMIRILGLSNKRLYIPYIEPELREDTPESEYVDKCIPPYALGVILGDGTITSGSVSIANFDIEIKNKFKDLIDDDLYIADRPDGTFAVSKQKDQRRNKWMQFLRYMDLEGKRSWEKHIPREYLEGSFKQRIELIQGMMDTDGCAEKHGSFYYSTTSHRLARDFQYLVRSVGGWAKIIPRQTYYTYKGEKKAGRLCYEVSLKYKKPKDFFTLPRKKNRVSNDAQYNNAWLRVVSIEETEAVESQCITVDHPSSLYVTKDFIVTHNTLTALHAMSRLGVRTMIHLRGGYVDRWLPDLKEFFKFKKGEMLIIRGRDSLLSLFNMAKANDRDFKKIKVIIVTSKTIYNYLKEFEKDPKRSLYEVRPEDMYELLGVGLKIVDEVHEDYHLNFKSDIYSNVDSAIYLSATLDSKDPFRTRMYSIAHPPETWISTKYDAYVDVRAKMYTMEKMGSVKTSHRGQDKYSHSAYELSILEKKELTANYLKIIYEAFSYEFFQETPYEPGQKCMIFCSTVEMCEVVCKFLLDKTSDLSVGVYVAGVPTKVLLESDIVVTTVESAGTAVDVKGLKVVLLTRALDKFEKNEQIKGRLRKMSGKWADIRPVMIYINNVMIDKHLEYHKNKLEYWKGLVHSHKTYHLNTKL